MKSNRVLDGEEENLIVIGYEERGLRHPANISSKITDFCHVHGRKNGDILSEFTNSFVRPPQEPLRYACQKPTIGRVELRRTHCWLISRPTNKMRWPPNSKPCRFRG